MQLNITSKIHQVLIKLGQQADKERSNETIADPDGRMLAITADTGMFFNILLKSVQAKRVLEVGTSTGYSTLWFADALKQNPSYTEKRIITIEENPSKVKRASRNFLEAEVSDMIEIRQGQANQILTEISKEIQQNYFDFVFLDADKENSISYFEAVLPLVRIGGIIAADNILHPDSCVPDMQRYSSYVKNKTDVQSVTLPIGNGEELTIRVR